MADQPPMTLDDIETIDTRTNRAAMEAMLDIFHRMPWGAEITLANGKLGTIKKFVEPRINPETGKPEFGFDLAGEDWHYEFFVRQTGWGSTP